MMLRGEIYSSVVWLVLRNVSCGCMMRDLIVKLSYLCIEHLARR